MVETYPSEKYEFVNWDDDIPNRWKNKFMFQTTNQTLACIPLLVWYSLHEATVQPSFYDLLAKFTQSSTDDLTPQHRQQPQQGP